MPLLDALGRSYIIRQTWDGKGLKHEKLGVHCSPLFTSIHGFNHVIRSIVNQLFGDGWSNVRYFSAFAWPPFALKSSLFSHLGMGQKKREQDAVGVHFFIVFSRMRSKGSRFTLGVWGLRVCSLDVALVVATVRTRTIWPCLWEVLQRWSFLAFSDVSLLRFAWQAWHFVTVRRVLERVESGFTWQAQYFCDVFIRCVAVFVAGAALWTCPSSFFVAGAAL